VSKVLPSILGKFISVLYFLAKVPSTMSIINAIPKNIKACDLLPSMTDINAKKLKIIPEPVKK
tara:strand:+ start:521 stop:709 length:189 start_codon:yes stop_codon:yes gene_type:complete